MYIDELLKELGTQMNLPDLVLDENRTCRLVFDQTLVVDIEASEDYKKLYIYSVICQLPPENRQAFYEILLEANLFGHATDGAVFAVDPDAGEVVLYRTLDPEHTDYPSFTAALESFVNQLENWTQRLQNSASAGESASEPRPFDNGYVKA